jgi:signal transduction histidine kinase/PAS domain-containing protein
MVSMSRASEAEHRLKLQYAVTRILAQSSDVADASAQILKVICEYTGWQCGMMRQVDQANNVLWPADTFWRAPAAPVSEFEKINREISFAPGAGLPGRVWANGQAAWVTDATEEYDPRAAIAAGEGLRTAVAFPIFVGEEVIGVAEFFGRESTAPDAALVEMLELLGRQIGNFIERKQAQEALRLSRDQLAAILQGVADGITALKRGEQAQRALAEAGKMLATSLDYNARLTSIAHLVVPHLADWCTVDIVDEDGAIHQVAVAHVDPAKVEMAHELRGRYPLDLNAPRGVPNVLRTGQPELYLEIPDSLLETAFPEAEQVQTLRALGLRSAMIVPLVARGRTLGALTFVWAESGLHYGPADLTLAEELAQRAALAVDNARLYAEAQRLNAELEERIVQRTIQLQNTNAELKNEIAERQRMQWQLEQSRAHLRRLSAHLQDAREEERTHIAREIHDELGQALTALKMDVAWLQDDLSGQPRQLRKIRAMSQLIDTTVQAVRRIATELRPGILDDLGLAAAIEWQLGEFQNRTGIECKLDSNVETTRLDGDSATTIFRILQETLTNVVRHAQATQVEVRLTEMADGFTLRVADNGRGITEEEINNSKSFGLLGMQERALLRDGEFQIRGAPGRGTTVTVRLPLK